MHATEVDCVISSDGRIRVRRIKLEGGWVSVEQGRQWEDEIGRHVLVMIGGTMVWELRLSRKTLRWTLHKSGTQGGARLV